MTCPYCDDELTARCDCGSPSCICGYCPKCEGSLEEETDSDDELPLVDDESE